MNDFIDKAAWGLNAIFSNGDGFPRTSFLFCGGIRDEKAYKRFLPTRQVQIAGLVQRVSALDHEEHRQQRRDPEGTVGSDERGRDESVARAIRRAATSCRSPASSLESSTAFRGTRYAGAASRRHPRHRLVRLWPAAAARAFSCCGSGTPARGKGVAEEARRSATRSPNRTAANGASTSPSRRPGLKQLGLRGGLVDQFAGEFTEGMAGTSTGSGSSATSARAARNDGAGAGLRNPRRTSCCMLYAGDERRRCWRCSRSNRRTLRVRG